MPELPEAETIARGLNAVLPGRRVEDVTVLREDVVEGPPATFTTAVSGRRVSTVGRRGKNVILEFDDGARVVVNLGMTGRLLPGTGSGPAPQATHPAVLFALDDGSAVTYDDIRRFGRLLHVASSQWVRWSRRLGPEPLSRSFSARRLASIVATSRSPIRSLLLDQRKIAGIGNIYAVEALWMARIHPRTPARDLPTSSIPRLHRSLRRVLREAIAARGTTLRDYRTAEGTSGGFGPALRAYGREGEPCARCRAPIVRIVFGGRSAYVCPDCQGTA